LSPLSRWGAPRPSAAAPPRLPAVARRRVHDALGHDIPFGRVTIIGDTPLDVDCALPSGALPVAVATGRYTGDELSACSPDVLFPDLSDVESVIDALCPGGVPS